MFVLLFAVSVIVAFGLAFGVSVIFKRMTATVLSRNLAENVSQATAKYLQIAILLVGVSNGARIQLLKDYLNTPAYGILWLMILFAFLAAVAVAFIRRSKIRWLLPERQEIRGSWSK